AFQGFSERLILILVPEPCDEGFEDESPSEPVPERFEKELVLILASEPRDEGFEEEAPLDPVSEGFKEQLVLVLASEGPPDSAPVSKGPAGSVSASEGLPGSASVSEGSPGTMKPKPDFKPPEFHRVPGGSSMLHGRPPDLPSRRSSTLLSRPPDPGSSTLFGRPPDRQFLRHRPRTLLFSHRRFPDQPASSRRCWSPRLCRQPPRSLRLCRPSPPTAQDSVLQVMATVCLSGTTFWSPAQSLCLRGAHLILYSRVSVLLQPRFVLSCLSINVIRFTCT
ncbi:hypothetical protein ILYODFUR_038438, partial [Ilyodon furcidens]